MKINDAFKISAIAILLLVSVGLLLACSNDNPGDRTVTPPAAPPRLERVWHARGQVDRHRERAVTIALPTTPPVAAEDLLESSNPCPSWSSWDSKGGVSPSTTQVAFSDASGLGFVVSEGVWEEASCQIFTSSANSGRTYTTITVGGPVAARVETSKETQDAAASGALSNHFAGSTVQNAAVLSTLEFLKTYNTCNGCDLSETDLSGIQFPSGASLVGADLSGAVIYNTTMEDADLTDANFGVLDTDSPSVIAFASLKGSTLDGTTFDQTYLGQVDLTDGQLTCPVFNDVVLLTTTLTDTSWNPNGSAACSTPNFEGAVIAIGAIPPDQWKNLWIDDSRVQVTLDTICVLKGADLSGMRFTDSQFTGLPPDFSSLANLQTTQCPATSATTFDGSVLDGSSFFLSDMQDATFNQMGGVTATSALNTDFIGATLDGTSFLAATLHGANFGSASAQNATFVQANLGLGSSGTEAKASFASADVRGATFKNAHARGVDWSGAYLFQGKNSTPVIFDGATLDNSNFGNALLGATSFVGASLVGAIFNFAQCISCDFTNSGGVSTKLDNATFEKAYIYGSRFTGAVLTNASFSNAECCSSGTWAFKAGSGAAAASVDYTLSNETDLDGAAFDNVAACPNGLKGRTGQGCQGLTTPTNPPGTPSCTTAAFFECPFVIDTVAGNGTAGYDNGGIETDALCAELDTPQGVTFDTATNELLFADSVNRRVRSVSGASGTSPIIGVFAGTGTAGSSGNNGPATQAELDSPYDVAFYSASHPQNDLVAISDPDANTVRVVKTDGTIIGYAGSGTACGTPSGACGDGGPALDAELNGPHGLWFDPLGNLYIADTKNYKIRKVDATSGVIVTVAGNGTQGNSGNEESAILAQLNDPLDVVGDSFGNLYIADTGNSVIRRVDPGGTIYQMGPSPSPLSVPAGLSVDSLNTLYVADSGNNRIVTLSLWGIANPIAGTGEACPDPVTTDCADPTPVCGDGGSAISAQFNGPVGIEAFAPGVIYITDTLDNRIRLLQSTH